MNQDLPSLTVTFRNMSSRYSLFGAAPVFSYENEYMEPNLTVINILNY